MHYHLRARIDSPDDSIRQNKDRVFLILSNLDLNQEPRASVSVLNVIIVVNIIIKYFVRVHLSLILSLFLDFIQELIWVCRFLRPVIWGISAVKE